MKSISKLLAALFVVSMFTVVGCGSGSSSNATTCASGQVSTAAYGCQSACTVPGTGAQGALINNICDQSALTATTATSTCTYPSQEWANQNPSVPPLCCPQGVNPMISPSSCSQMSVTTGTAGQSCGPNMIYNQYGQCVYI